MKSNCSCLWYLIRTKPKNEARAETNLHTWGIETFAPKMREKRRARTEGRIVYVEVEAPLFPSYIFARFDGVNRLHNVRMTRGVHSVVGFGECATPVDESIIDLLRQRMDAVGFVRLEEPRPGDNVRIISGPLSSLEGIFQRRTSPERVLILLATVLSRVPVEVAHTDIVKI